MRKNLKNYLEKGIYANKIIKKNEIIKNEHLIIRRPENMLKPIMYRKILGKRVKKEILEDESINLKIFKLIKSNINNLVLTKFLSQI